MSNSTSIINVNVDSDVKEEATNLFNSLVLNMSTAINIFLRKAINVGGLPFEVKNPKPSKEMIQALKEADDIISGKVQAKGYHNVDEMFQDLDIDD